MPGIIDERYEFYESKTDSDIYFHMPTLAYYAGLTGARTILELGTRTLVSTWAFLMGRPSKMICVDLKDPSEYSYEGTLNLLSAKTATATEGIKFEFIQANDLDVADKLPDFDLIFIDTDHTYDQLKKELKLYGSKAKKYLIFHDTNIEEMTLAIHEFLASNKKWFLLERSYENNGLIVLKKLEK